MLTRPPPAPGAPRALAGVCAVLIAAGCGETLKDTYSIEIAGPPDTFSTSATVELLVNGQVVAARAVSGSGGFELSAPDLDPTLTRTAILAIRGLDASGKIVAFGQTPQMEVLKVSPVIRIFVQKPGTLVRARDLSAKTKDHVAVPAESGAVGPDLSLDVTVPFFGAGRQTVPSASGEQELLSDRLYVYNPIIHLQQDVGRASGGLRAEASAIAKNERVYVFGGLAQTNVMEAPKTTAILDLIVVGREGFSSFFLEMAPAYDGGTEAARKRTVLATAGRPVFAFGGLDSADRPLDSVVLIDVDTRPQMPVSLLPMRMVGAREGHTATTVSTSDPWGNILVFGGAAADKPVAELFEPMKSEWLPVDLSMAGSGRRDHVALNLPASTEPRVLILGGRGPDMAPRADSVIYYPAQRAFGPSPLTLQQPRTGFVAFVINDDLVVAGGYDATGKLIETAEVYDVKNWQLQGTPAAVPRARATATALPNLSVVILGGETSGSSSNAVEIYQPRR